MQAAAGRDLYGLQGRDARGSDSEVRLRMKTIGKVVVTFSDYAGFNEDVEENSPPSFNIFADSKIVQEFGRKT